MKTIYKYPLDLQVLWYQKIQLPKNARILSVQYQGDVICIWALVDPDAPPVIREVFTCGTGHLLVDEIEQKIYLATLQMPGSTFVWHVFISPEDDEQK